MNLNDCILKMMTYIELCFGQVWMKAMKDGGLSGLTISEKGIVYLEKLDDKEIEIPVSIFYAIDYMLEYISLKEDNIIERLKGHVNTLSYVELIDLLEDIKKNYNENSKIISFSYKRLKLLLEKIVLTRRICYQNKARALRHQTYSYIANLSSENMLLAREFERLYQIEKRLREYVKDNMIRYCEANKIPISEDFSNFEMDWQDFCSMITRANRKKMEQDVDEFLCDAKEEELALGLDYVFSYPSPTLRK